MAIRLLTRTDIESLAHRLFRRADSPYALLSDTTAAQKDMEDAAIVLGVLVAMGIPCHAIVIDY